MTDPLFAALPGPAGPLRKLVDERIAQLAEQQVDLPADLALVVRSLADRIDEANGARAYRGFVMLTAEFRSARRDLFDSVTTAGDDGFEAALAEFRAAEAGHAEGPAPAH